MGRHKGSITRCGYCYDDGHNRRTCPDLIKHAEKNPDSYIAQRRNAQKERNSSRKRKCSYCNESGHNRKTCQVFKADTEQYFQMNAKYQRKILKAMKKLGFGVGSLVKTNVNGDVNSNRFFMVSKIHWERINVANWYRSSMGDVKDYPFILQRLDISGLSEYDRRSSNIRRSTDMPDFLTNEAGLAKSHYNNRYLQMVSPVQDGHGIPSLIDTEAGVEFLSHADYKDTFGCQTIVRIGEKLRRED